MCRRITTARDQYAMTAPWRTADITDGYHPHPDLEETQRVHGSRHVTGGRVLPHRVAVADLATQTSRLADPVGWQHHVSFTPSGLAIAGARAYSGLVGLPDPHQHGYDHVKQDANTVATVGRHYDSLPDMDKSAIPHFQAMRNEVNQQHDFMTNRLGIRTQTVDHDPYADVHEMMHDVNNNKTLKVMGTHVTGAHPFFSDGDNDKFRAVHDFFGHAATGRSFDRHGEQAAYLAHSQMFSPAARPALASETKGQNTSLILNGHFGPQKIATMAPQHWNDSSLGGIMPTSSYREAVAPAFDDEWKREVEKAVDNHGGYTFHDRPGDGPTSGFMVATPDAEKKIPREEFSGDSAAEYRKPYDIALTDPDLYQGGWDDKDSGHFYHDISRHTNDFWDAGAIGRGSDSFPNDAQHGIYHLDSDTTFSPLEINHGGTPGWTMARKED